jgi:hypothetical protein
MIGGAFDKTAKFRGQAACVRGTVSSGAVEKWEVAIVALSFVGRSRACASVSLFPGAFREGDGQGEEDCERLIRFILPVQKTITYFDCTA